MGVRNITAGRAVRKKGGSMTLARRVCVIGIFWAVMYLFFSSMIPMAIDRELDCQQNKIKHHLQMIKGDGR